MGNENDIVQETAKKGKAWKVILIIIVILAVIVGGAALYVKTQLLDVKTFPSGSTINSVDVSGLTKTEAVDKIRDSINDSTMTITENGNVKDSISDCNFEFDISDDVAECLNPGFMDAALRFVDKDKRHYTIDIEPEEPLTKFNREFRKLSIVKDYHYTTKTKNAYVDLSTDDFKVVKEVYGDDLDKEKLREAILNAYLGGKKTFEFDPEKYRKQPSVKSDSKEIQDRLEYCKKYLATKITYKGPNGNYTISPKWLDRMIRVEDGEISVRSSQVKKFVSTVLASKMSTVGRTRHLKSRGGGSFTVTGGDYGYILDQTKEAKKLTKNLESGKDVTREPVYSLKGKGNGENDIGSNYVEISIGKQHLWVVRNNKTVVSTDIVSGNTADGHATPTGTFYIKYMATNVTLKGSNADGSDYESYVNYWMPFTGDIGMHDASWRSSFGGSIYQGSGSHGCVNCPPSITGKIYSNVYSGMPVVVH